MLSIKIVKQWPLYQLGVNNVFLQGNLQEEVYMGILQGFTEDSNNHIRKV